MEKKRDKRSVSRARAKRELVVLCLIPALVTLCFLVLSLVKQEPRITLRLLPLIALPLLAYVPAVHRWRVNKRRERLGESEERVPVLTLQSYVHEGKLKLLNSGVVCLLVALAIFLPSLFWIREENNPELWLTIGFFVAIPLIAGLILPIVAWARMHNRRTLVREKGLRVLELPLEEKETITREEYSYNDSYNDKQESKSYYLNFRVIPAKGKEKGRRLSYGVSLDEFSRAREGNLYYCLVDVLHGDPSLERCYAKYSVRLGSDLSALLQDPDSLQEEIRLSEQEAKEAAKRREQEEERLRQLKAVGGEALREFQKQYREDHREERKKKRNELLLFLLSGFLLTLAAPFVIPLIASLELELLGVFLGVLAIILLLFAAAALLIPYNVLWGTLWFLLILVLSLAPLPMGWL